MTCIAFVEELEDVADIRGHTVPTLEQAFARIIDRCGLPRDAGHELMAQAVMTTNVRNTKTGYWKSVFALKWF